MYTWGNMRIYFFYYIYSDLKHTTTYTYDTIISYQYVIL